MTDKLEVRLSSTALSNSGCMYKFNKRVIEGYGQLPVASAVFGIAWHKFVETMYKTKGDMGAAFGKSLEVFRMNKHLDPKKEHINDEKFFMTVACLMWEKHKNDATFSVIELDGEPMVETQFDLLLYEDESVIVKMQGTLDMIGLIKGGCYAIGDWKNTSFWDKEKYLKSYELSKQLRFYRLALKLISEQYPDSTLGKLGNQRIGAFVNAIFLNKDISKIEMIKTDVFQYTNEEIEEFRLLVMNFVNKLVSHIKANNFPQEGILNGVCQSTYGFCDYWNVCRVNTQAVKDALFKNHFIQKPFTPLDYNN